VPIHIFTGPTAVKEVARETIPGCRIHPPAQHGDFIRNRFSSKDIVLLIDGLYHTSPPIRHKEILESISRGATVIGASSMGALRASELHTFGMIGVGKIFEYYRDGVIEGDDEVAVLHTAGPEWKVLSEALVNMRHTLAAARLTGVITETEKEGLLAVARSLHYPRRSWRAVLQACEQQDPSLREAAGRVLGFHQENGPDANLKYQDACTGLRYAHALAEGASPPHGKQADDWPAGWQTTYLRKWNREFTGDVQDGRFVSTAQQLDFQRLFGPDQPQRWRRYVLSAMAGLTADAPLAELEEQSLSAAHAMELSCASIPDGQMRHWLTGSEQEQLTEQEKLLTVLVRSSRLTADLSDGPAARWLLPQAERNRALISSSLHINEQVAASSFSKHIDHLKKSVLEKHLRLIWGLPADAAIDLAARERGFASTAEAAEALRPFFLKDYNDRRQNGA